MNSNFSQERFFEQDTPSNLLAFHDTLISHSKNHWLQPWEAFPHISPLSEILLAAAFPVGFCCLHVITIVTQAAQKQYI